MTNEHYLYLAYFAFWLLPTIYVWRLLKKIED